MTGIWMILIGLFILIAAVVGCGSGVASINELISTNTWGSIAGLLLPLLILSMSIDAAGSYGLVLAPIMMILFTITGIAMLIPMDSSILSLLRPFSLKKSVLPQYQLSPRKC